ncbi:MAG: zf-HC2 domain-containing protein [Acidobacteriota bacterium]
MKCWRVYMRRNFMRYLDGELDALSEKRMENHLMDCGWCRSRLARLREGQRLARQIPSLRPVRDRWDEIQAAVESGQSPSEAQESHRPRVLRPGAAIAITAAAFLVALLGMIASKDSSVGGGGASFDTSMFQSVEIADIPSNTSPHVVTEGYVSELRLDPDGDMTFRLVEDINRPDPFIVCEIIKSISLPPPAIGSRVRVYGVSRFDGQPDRQWHEVHPVLNIEVVRR